MQSFLGFNTCWLTKLSDRIVGLSINHFRYNVTRYHSSMPKQINFGGDEVIGVIKL